MRELTARSSYPEGTAEVPKEVRETTSHEKLRINVKYLASK